MGTGGKCYRNWKGVLEDRRDVPGAKKWLMICTLRTHEPGYGTSTLAQAGSAETAQVSLAVSIVSIVYTSTTQGHHPRAIIHHRPHQPRPTTRVRTATSVSKSRCTKKGPKPDTLLIHHSMILSQMPNRCPLFPCPSLLSCQRKNKPQKGPS